MKLDHDTRCILDKLIIDADQAKDRAKAACEIAAYATKNHNWSTVEDELVTALVRSREAARAYERVQDFGEEHLAVLPKRFVRSYLK